MLLLSRHLRLPRRSTSQHVSCDRYRTRSLHSPFQATEAAPETTSPTLESSPHDHLLDEELQLRDCQTRIQDVERLLLEAGHLHVIAVVVLRLVPPQRVADAIEQTQVGEHDAVRLLQLLHHLLRVQRLVHQLGGSHVHADAVATEDDAGDVRRGVELEPLLLQPAMLHDAGDVATVVDEKRLLPDRVLVDAAMEEGVDAGAVSSSGETPTRAASRCRRAFPGSG